MSTAKARLMRRTRKYLAIWKENIKLDNGQGLTDINSDAEDFCCGLLNIVLGVQLRNMNLERMNFPAIDLGDRESRICVQVTSTADAEKLTHTLERFFAHGLEQDYDRLIVMILGDKHSYRKNFPEKAGFRFDPAEDVWDIRKLLIRIAGLTMPVLYQLDAYLREQFGELGELTPPMDLPVLSALDDNTFLGRNEELAAIAGRFEQNEKLVFLSGLGGMGKSELAVRFAQTRWGGESYFVHFTKNWRQTVLTNIAPRIRGLNRDTADEDRIYRDAMAELKSRSAEELLILDNADQERPSLTRLRRELSELDMRILVTTRTDAERAIRVDRLNREELRRLFALHESNASPEEQDALIDAVDSHTLTVDLMARALRPGRKAATARKLLTDLSDGTIRRVETAYPGGPDQARIIEHLKVVFRVSDLGSEEKTLLRYATLLPDGGMEDSLFLADLGADLDDTLTDLTDNGWLQWKDGMLSIHPVIRKVCREELKPSDENCGAYLEGLIAQYDERNYQPVRYRQMAQMLTNASVQLGDAQGKWALDAGKRWRDVGDYAQAHDCALRALKKREQSLPPEHPDLASAYNGVGVTYSELGDHRKSLEHHLKALAIREKVLPEGHPDLALSYHNVGVTYVDLGDHGKALEYKHKALAIREKVLPENHPDLASSYGSMGCTYGDLGDHRRALEYHMKALAIKETILPDEHPVLAQSYENVGISYGNSGDHGNALEYLLKALVIQENALPVDHPNLAASYNNIACTYGGLGENKKALDYHTRALAIWEKALPNNHPHVAISCSNVGCAYGNLGDHGKALEYHMKALAIWEKALPQNHPDIANACNNIAWTRRQMSDLQAAAQYMRRAADIINSSSLPKDHPHRVNYTRWADAFEQEAKRRQELMEKLQELGWELPPFGKK